MPKQAFGSMEKFIKQKECDNTIVVQLHKDKKLEQQLGLGVFNALRGHGGLTAKILSSGPICIGDALEVRLQEIPGQEQQGSQAKLL